MIGNSMEYNQLMNNLYYRNSMNQNYANPIYYQSGNGMVNMNQMNMQFNPYQFCQNNYINNYQNSFYHINKNNLFYYNLNKFNSFYPKNYFQKPIFSKNKTFTETNNEADKINLKNKETSFEENSIKKEKTKKYSINTTACSNSFNESSSDEENDEKEEMKEETKQEVLENEEMNDIPNFSNTKKGKRRLSNTSKTSNYSKVSKSTLDTSIYSIKEKDVSEILEEKNDNLKENDNKTCFNEKYQINPAFENTEILNVNVKLSKDRTAIFKLKRFDDLFLTIKLFCEINSVDEKLIKPLIIKSLTTLNTIYQVMNSKLDGNQIGVLKNIKNL